MRRFWIALAVLVVVLIAVDRVGVLATDLTMESALKSRLELTDKPKVRVHGIPFLTQVVGGKYNNVSIDVHDLDAGQAHDLDADVTLRGVHLGVGKLLTFDINKVTIDKVRATVTVPYSELARLSGRPGVRISADGDHVKLTGPLTVAGRTVTAQVTAQVAVNGGAVQVVPESASAGGISLPGAAVQAYRFSVPVAGLPFGLRLTDLKVRGDGVATSAASNNVTVTSDDLRRVQVG